MRKLFILFFLFSFSFVKAQELNCIVNINSDQIGVSNKQIFTTMQEAVFEFMNNTKWTNINYKNHEKVECSITINILENPSPNSFKGKIQLQVSRPVYDSTYKTPVLTFNDNDVSFSYEEYQPLVYNRNNFDSNLTSLLTFYAYTMLGFHADTFTFKGGENYFKEAENVVNLAQQGGGAGWKRIDGNFTRYQLNENLLSPVYDGFRETMYVYHLQGLDRMVENKTEAKKTIASSVKGLQKIYDSRPNTYLIRVFMDTKSDEIVDIFADGPRIDAKELKDILSRIYPSFDQKWQKIKI